MSLFFHEEEESNRAAEPPQFQAKLDARIAAFEAARPTGIDDRLDAELEDVFAQVARLVAGAAVRLDLLREPQTDEDRRRLSGDVMACLYSALDQLPDRRRSYAGVPEWWDRSDEEAMKALAANAADPSD
jgi:hypothetical protein